MTQRKTTAQKIIDYFTVNPEDSLAVSDAVLKFGVSATQAARIFSAMETKGVLKKEIEPINSCQGRAIFSKA